MGENEKGKIPLGPEALKPAFEMPPVGRCKDAFPKIPLELILFWGFYWSHGEKLLLGLQHDNFTATTVKI